jgi:hypothetical protein
MKLQIILCDRAFTSFEVTLIYLLGKAYSRIHELEEARNDSEISTDQANILS